MGLDKWLKTDEKKEVEKKKPPKKKKPAQKKAKAPKKKPEPPVSDKKIKKYLLICPKKACKYQKTVMKKQLSEKDLICKRCKGELKVKEI